MPDFSVIEATLQTALDEGQEYLDADVAMEALAAIEVLAKSLGHGTQTDVYTEKVDEWLETVSLKPSTDLLLKAQQVLIWVLSDQSELKDLWQEADDYDIWLASIQQHQRCASLNTSKNKKGSFHCLSCTSFYLLN